MFGDLIAAAPVSFRRKTFISVSQGMDADQTLPKKG